MLVSSRSISYSSCQRCRLGGCCCARPPARSHSLRRCQAGRARPPPAAPRRARWFAGLGSVATHIPQAASPWERRPRTPPSSACRTRLQRRETGCEGAPPSCEICCSPSGRADRSRGGPPPSELARGSTRCTRSASDPARPPAGDGTKTCLLARSLCRCSCCSRTRGCS
ncbi:hypothetical protein T492DRAFT_180239 [Pavlovales sp. CCMP2436]|nr:hypothetical protein T492DRAFT_180239 [Pavlovales sp. CCMP2436]